MNTPARPFGWLATTAILTLSTASASAATPRSDRVAARIAERAYARQSIAEARAVRAEARVAAIAPVTPVPPPSRPATVRRMLRAGVPLNAAPPTPAMPPVVMEAPLPQRIAAQAVAPPAAPPATPAAPTPTPAATANVADDGTRSVLATAEVPAAVPATREPAGPAVTHPPIELLPTPQPQ